MNLKNKKVLITGGARRLGAIMTRALVKEKAKVFVHYYSSKKEAQTLSQELRIPIFQANLTEVEEIEKLFESVKKELGSIDILINNAALFFKTPFLKTTEKEWNQFIDINLKSVFFCSQRAVKLMNQKNGGLIIHIADVGGHVMWTEYLAYCVSKAGVLALTKGMAKELAPRIRVNAVAPGPLLLPKGYSEKESAKHNLLKKIGSPDQLVSAILFLIKNDFVTGDVIYLDGGRKIA